MTWCSENSTPAGFLLANSTIQWRFVNRFAGSIVPSRVSRHWFSLRGASLPSCGVPVSPVPPLSAVLRRHYDFPPAHLRSLMDWLAQPTRSLLLSCSPQRSRKAEGFLPDPGLCCAGRPPFRLLARGREWDLSGLQTIHPVPLLRSSTPVEPTYPRHLGYVDTAPATRTAKASATFDFGAHSRSFGTC